MTVLAQIAAGNMRGILSCCLCAVVTAGTVGSDAGVAELCGNPCRSVVAGFASISADDVTGRLAGGFHTIVAIEAVTRDGTMIKTRRHP